LTPTEQDLIRKEANAHVNGGKAACKEVNRRRARKDIDEISYSAVCRFLAGETHLQGKAEVRGRDSVLTNKDKHTLDITRQKLVKKANNQYRVTYEDVVNDAWPRLSGEPCLRVCADALRERGVSYTKPREKVYLSDEDAKKRWVLALEWVKLNDTFWTKHVHAYIDHKKFPLPLTVAQRQRYRQRKIAGHLRKPSEGMSRGFTKPKGKSSYVILPTVNIGAAVCDDRIICWHEEGPKWNGSVAEAFYRGPLIKAMKRKWGNRRSFTVVEDGDRKGYQTKKCIKAKSDLKIKSMTLSPRSPALMPLDYAIWNRIEQIMNEEAPNGCESKVRFLARLRKVAKGLPKAWVRSQVLKMKANLQGIIDAKGWHARND
jgi:hypothetical protein